MEKIPIKLQLHIPFLETDQVTFLLESINIGGAGNASKQPDLRRVKYENIVLIDYGFKNINIILIKNKVLYFIKKIPQGSVQISNDLVNIHNISFDFAEKLKISTIDLSDTRNSTVEIPIWEDFGDNKKKNVGHDNLKEITLDRLDETFELVLKSLPKDKSFYSYVFKGGGSKIKNFYNYFRTKHGYDIQFLEPPKSCGIPKVLNDASIMSLY